MRIQIEKKLQRDLKRASQHMGLKEEEIATRALLLYLDSIWEKIELDEELRAWDAASDEALVHMERSLETKV